MGLSCLEEDGGENVVDVLTQELFVFTELLARAEEGGGCEDLMGVGAGHHLPSTDGQDVMFLGQHGSSETGQAETGDCGLRPEEELQQQVQHSGV